MRFYPNPELLAPLGRMRRRTLELATSAPKGAQYFQNAKQPGAFYALFTYNGEQFAVQVPVSVAEDFLTRHLPRRFPGLDKSDLEIHFLSEREDRKASERRIEVRWDGIRREHHLTAPGQQFMAVSDVVRVHSNETVKSHARDGGCTDFARDLAVMTTVPVGITVHPTAGLWQRLRHGDEPQCISVSAADEQREAAVSAVAHRLYDHLGWSHQTFDLVWTSTS